MRCAARLPGCEERRQVRIAALHLCSGTASRAFRFLRPALRPRGRLFLPRLLGATTESSRGAHCAPPPALRSLRSCCAVRPVLVDFGDVGPSVRRSPQTPRLEDPVRRPCLRHTRRAAGPSQQTAPTRLATSTESRSADARASARAESAPSADRRVDSEERIVISAASRSPGANRLRRDAAQPRTGEVSENRTKPAT